VPAPELWQALVRRLSRPTLVRAASGQRRLLSQAMLYVPQQQFLQSAGCKTGERSG
jgi:hypothetical protein